MAKNESEEKLKIYVTPRGGVYVKPEELLANPKVLEKIKRMAEISIKRRTSDTSPKDRTQ